jgi:phosphoglycerate dehydrogenase-like enzyme
VVRRSDEPVAGADRTITTSRLHEVLPRTDVLVLALALTPETAGIIGAPELAALPDHALLVNVARGGHVDTDAIVEALASERLGGAAFDVTDPEPLPDGHPLWSEPRCLITPHVANTPEMGLALLEPFVAENVRRFCVGEDLLATVDVALGY